MPQSEPITHAHTIDPNIIISVMSDTSAKLDGWIVPTEPNIEVTATCREVK